MRPAQWLQYLGFALAVPELRASERELGTFGSRELGTFGSREGLRLAQVGVV